MNIKQLSRLFGSKIKAEEILYLLHDLKPVVRQGFYDHELPVVEKFCKKYGLVSLKSKFKVILADEGAYSNKGIRVKEDDSGQGMFFVYISKDEKKAYLAEYYELVQSDKELGLILGYPKCCVTYFLEHFNENNPNPVQVSKNIYTNISQREKDLVLISHCPCSPGCSESISLGEKNLALLRKIDQERAKVIVDGLS
ncbi:DUF483 domain-containing protein [Candidatus Woesearchaeota archaeon]|nr:DUF483 domain-containing protein [Candidatus Woesearchaeota archaeon]